MSFNIIFCSLNRFKSIWEILIKPRIEVDEDFILGLKINAQISGKKEELEKLLEALYQTLKSKKYKIKKTSTGLFEEKGKIGRVGPFITHLSILIILLGGIISSLSGFKEFFIFTSKKLHKCRVLTFI